MAVFVGTSGDDNLTGTSGNDKFKLAQGGDDTADGGGGNDLFQMGATLTAADQIDGGAGHDKVVLKGDYSAGLVFAATTMVGVETLRLVGPYDYNLTMNDGNVAAGDQLKINASSLDASHQLVFDGSAESDGHFLVFGGAGDDTIIGGAKADRFHLGQGGDDIVDGGDGNDVVNMAASLTAADQIDGGRGNDRVVLDGDYSAGLVFGATTMVRVETLQLTGGHSYDLTTNNATVAGGHLLTVDASSLGAGDTLVFDGSVETNGHFDIVAGAGNDVLTGGKLDNIFDLSAGGNDTAQGTGSSSNLFEMGAAFTAADTLTGGSSINDTVALDGDYTGSHAVVFSATTMQGVETLSLAAGHSYDLTTNDATIVAGGYIIVDASALGATDGLTLNASAETDGRVFVYDGAGNDIITGGADDDVLFLLQGGNDKASGGSGGQDVFDMGATLTAADHLDGGSDYDSLYLDGDYTGAHAVTFSATTMVNTEIIYLSTQSSGGFSYDLTTNDATIASGQTLYVYADYLASTDTLQFNASAETNGYLQVEFGAGFTAQDRITGGATNNDNLMLIGDYTGANALVFAATTMQGIERVYLEGDFNYDLTMNDGNVAAGKILYVNALIGASYTLTFDGSAETDGSFRVEGGAGDDLLTGSVQGDFFGLNNGGDDVVYGGGGNDTFFMEGALTAADRLDGQSGNDTLDLDGDYTGANAVVFGATTMVNVERIHFANDDAPTSNYDLTINDANVAAGQTLTVDESSMILGETLTFDGSAESDGSFVFLGGLSDDVLVGGALSDVFSIGDDSQHDVRGNDVVTGGGGGDIIHASSNSADHDTFVYLGTSDSTSTGYDTITSLNFTNDTIRIGSFAVLPTTIDAAVSAGNLSTASFDGDLAAAIGAGQLGAHDAVLFTANAGTLSGHTFLVVDVNGQAGYQAGADLVIDVTGYSGTLTTGDFA